jgi:hypothetical protein
LLRPGRVWLALPNRLDPSFVACGAIYLGALAQALRRLFAVQAIAPVIDSVALHQHHQIAGIIRIRFAKLRQGWSIGSEVRDIPLLQISVGQSLSP